MRIGGSLMMCGAIWLVACGGSSKTPRGPRGSDQAGASGQCTLLTVADIQAVTRATVQRIERDPTIGAGGTCVNFASADGQAYLGVNDLKSRGEYSASVRAVPADVYPNSQPLTGLGDEAVLFKGPGGLRYLVARKGEVGVVLFPMGEATSISDDQLRDLADRALAGHR